MTHPVVTAARGWLGTRFHHQGRVKINSDHAGGVDCLGLLVGVAKELDLYNSQGIKLALCDEIDYTHTPDSSYLYQKLCQFLSLIPVGEIMEGDILLLRINKSPQHLAIVSKWKNGLGIIHAYAPAKYVVEHSLDQQWR